MKKLFAILLAVAMIMAMATTAFAENTTLTIKDSNGRTYAGYQLMELTTSLKTGDQHTDHEGDHTEICYNYAYTINEKYLAIFQEEVFANGGNYLWGEAGKPATSAGITEAHIENYLKNQQTDTHNTMPQVADRLYRAIKAAGIAPDAENMTGTNDNIAQGYWLIADVTTLTGNEANSLVMIDTKGQLELIVTPKTALPTVEKKTKDIKDSADNNILDNDWVDSADHDIGDTVPFKLTGTLPSNFANYIVMNGTTSTHPYQMIFHDTLSEGLTLNAGSIKVYMYETAHKATVDTDMNDYAADVTAYFTTATTCGCGCSFTVSCPDVIVIPNVTKDSAFVVYYAAELNENAVHGAAGNPNEVYLEFTNDPYSDNTGKTEPNKVIIYTYKLTINKVDAQGNALKGAGFTLYKKDSTGTFNPIPVGEDAQGNPVYELKGENLTTFEWKGLDDGDYKLSETTVPAGYNEIADIVFAVSAEHANGLTYLDGGLIGTGVVDTGVMSNNIVNNTGAILPETGAEGTFFLITTGTLLVIVAGVFMITRKKMSIFED